MKRQRWRETEDKNAARSGLVDFRIDAEVRARPAAAWTTDWKQHSAAVVQPASQRRMPLGSEIRIHCDQEVISRHEMRAARGVDRAVRRNSGRDIDSRPLRAARNCRGHCIRTWWPGKLRRAEPDFAWIGSRWRTGSECREAHFVGGVVRCDLHQP